MIAALALAMVPDASACGGFFCNNIDPVEQRGEAIVFEVDPVAGPTGQTTMHVQVTYEGPATEFAWIVPVRGEPNLFQSTDVLFQQLDMRTRPQFWLEYDFGECGDDWWWGADEALDASVPPVADSDGGVNVLAQERVGPYDTVTLQADDAETLITWLQENDYAIPTSLTDVVSPYVAADHNFVALRLASGETTGDLVPLGLTYDGMDPAIPIQLTAVAATDDMQVVTYVLGEERAIPSNYLHVELNESAINWFNGGQNYMDVLSRAADEAGGHAFTTEFAGSTDNFAQTFYNEAWDDLPTGEVQTALDFVRLVTQSGLPASSSLLTFLETHVPVPEGYNSRDVYNCPDCYVDDPGLVIEFDRDAALAALDVEFLEPLRQVQGMFDRTTVLTRLGSTMSAAEMTVDPIFSFNPDLTADVSNQHRAVLEYECAGLSNDPWENSAKTLRLADGTEIGIPSIADLREMGMTEATYLDSLQDPAAARIEIIGTSGQPEVLYDGAADIRNNIDDFNQQSRRIARGCSSVTGTAGLWLVGLLPFLLRRRD